MKKIGLIIILSVLMVSMFSGCNNKSTVNNGKIDKKDYTIKYWCEIPASLAARVKNLGETEWAKKVNELTGINVEYIHPTAGQESAQFNLMLASKNLPDVIETNLYGRHYSNGIHGALDEGLIIDLQELIDKKAPNLVEYLDKYPDVKKGITMPDGQVHSLPFIGADNFNTFGGMILRKDYLDKFNLEVPETMDEWENVLYTFKKNGVKYPFIARQDAGLVTYPQPFATAYGVTPEFYLGDDGKVKFGYSDGDLKSYVTRMVKWQKDGIIDPEWYAQNAQVMRSKILNNEAGAFFGFLGGEMGVIISTARNSGNAELKLVGAKYPSLNKGELQRYTRNKSPRFRDTTANITSASKQPEIVMEWLDKAYYSKEGVILSNYGTEGVSYSLENGEYIYTDLVMKNPEGLSMADVLTNYTRANVPRIGVTLDGYFKQYYSEPSVRDAAIEFAKTDSDKYMLPPLLYIPKQEQEEFDKILSRIHEYLNEEVSKIIVGIKPVSEIDNVVAEVKRLGADKLVEIKQRAYNKLK